jgi:hypothetical protein
MKHGTVTLVDALFQEAYICASVGCTSQDYNSRPQVQISMLSLSLFIRHYCGNPLLVSCPPLTYMLKFSGLAALTSCLGGKP